MQDSVLLGFVMSFCIENYNFQTKILNLFIPLLFQENFKKIVKRLSFCFSKSAQKSPHKIQEKYLEIERVLKSSFAAFSFFSPSIGKVILVKILVFKMPFKSNLLRYKSL